MTFRLAASWEFRAVKDSASVHWVIEYYTGTNLLSLCMSCHQVLKLDECSPKDIQRARPKSDNNFKNTDSSAHLP
jgi:hypothetical protein